MIPQIDIENGYFDFDHDLFTNRETEKALINKIIDGHESEQRIIEFIGIAGQGKTELLKWTCAKAKEKGVASAYIDFELAKFHRPEIHLVLENICTNLMGAKYTNNFFIKFNRALNGYKTSLKSDYKSNRYGTDERGKKLEALEKSLVSYFNDGMSKALGHSKIILCMDSTEKAYFDAIWRFEEQILEPTIKNENFLIVAAGQTRLKWPISFRNNLFVYDLKPFEYKDMIVYTERMSGKNKIIVDDFDRLTKKIWDVTSGHPYGIYKCIDLATDGFEKKNIRKEHIDNIYPLFVKSVIKKRILADLELGKEYPPAEKILLYIAPLRRLEISTVWFMLNTFLTDWFADKPYIFIEELIGKFQKSTHVFSSWHLGEGYEMDEITRNVLIEDWKTNRPNEFREIQRVLVNKYEDWTNKTKDASQIKNFVEKIYHKSILLNALKSEKIAIEIQNEINDFVRIHCAKENFLEESLRDDQISRLKKAIKNDQELSTMMNIQDNAIFEFH